MYPLHLFNLSIVNVKGRSDIFLKLEIIKKVLIIITIIIALPFGIWYLIVSRIFCSFASYYLNSYFSGKFINYPIVDQIKDIAPILLLSIVVGAGIWVLNLKMNNLPDIFRLIIGFGVGGAVYWFIAKISNFSPYLEFMQIVKSKWAETSFLKAK
jgi:ethanolamine transporter EutH